jgi:hypothetical protein
MECLDCVKNASFFTFFKTKSEFVFFGKDLEKKANSDFVENNVKKLAFFHTTLTIALCKPDTESAEMWNKNRYLRPSGYVLWQQERGREPKIGPTQKRTMMGRDYSRPCPNNKARIIALDTRCTFARFFK